MSQTILSSQNKSTRSRKSNIFYTHIGKYIFDALIALTVLILTSPLFLIFAIMIKRESEGPVFFKQDRVGKNGKIFKIFKFRTMTVMDNGHHIQQAKRGDARITKIGAFLRMTSLDELPQIFNVLLGEMSIVGPRPHAVAHDKEFSERVPNYTHRHNVLPGITGYAQVKGYRGETDTDNKLLGRIKYDLKYESKLSFWLDLKILFKTIWAVIRPQNAY
ncbi:MAG: exopolysaccharide biosynthesis polyprenyl glycosylphosphotransferase [Pseudomonadota bacterium]